jgi:hypothetical protein
MTWDNFAAYHVDLIQPHDAGLTIANDAPGSSRVATDQQHDRNFAYLTHDVRFQGIT